jgi:hypothetical protein
LIERDDRIIELLSEAKKPDPECRISSRQCAACVRDVEVTPRRVPNSNFESMLGSLYQQHQ